MIKRINSVIARLKAETISERATQGQTALILILLTAAALIFLAISLNWGRVAQTKVLVTIAADEGASLLASDVASYGEMQKQTYLNDSNQVTEQNGILMAIITVVVVIIIAIIIEIVSWGAATPFVVALMVASLAMAEVNLALQLLVVQPGITALWNKLQASQPPQQQFYEGGIAAAIQGSIGDQVNITDYMDWNANGKFGATGTTPNDTVSRFAVFYTDRLKMLNQPPIPQVGFFYDQLGELINGETCTQNENDCQNYPAVFGVKNCLNAACSNLNPSQTYCVNNPIDAACQIKIPNVFQLNDACPADSNTGDAGYSPYCDPCCQPASAPDPAYCNPATLTLSDGTACTANSAHPNPTISIRPSSCADKSATPSQCLENNPYGAPYYFLYDPVYQNYASGLSFLDQFGRDRQAPLPGEPPFTSLTTQGNFPNGIYPFFWLMKDYSPQVDNINSSSLQVSQDHWCTTTVASSYTAPTGYTDLAQLSLPYACSGQDCCVNYLASSVTNGLPSSSSTVNGQIDMVTGSPVVTAAGPNSYSTDPSFGEGGAGTWTEGDNEMCVANWPYNGATAVFPDGTCQWTDNATPPSSASPIPNISTVDSLDDAGQMLSDFVKFSNVFLNNNIGTLSSSFDTWYPQVAGWIAPACPVSGATTCTHYFRGSESCTTDYSCNVGSNGRLLSIYAPANYPNIKGVTNTGGTAVDQLNNWNNVITAWLSNNYTPSSSPYPWCAPPESDPSLNVNGSPTVENNYISTLGNTVTASSWVGDLPHVMACENYNAAQDSAGFGPVYNYTQCQTALSSGACPSSLPAQCAALTLGRSLAGPAPNYDGCKATYANWVNNSLTLAADESPKFALRAQFLNDIYTRAKNMQGMLQQGDKALGAFLKPCASSDTACQSGGPAAQLIWARSQPDPTANLPHSVIYGWVDNPHPNGQLGAAHIVKITAYSPGRGGSFALSMLPWIQTSSSFLTRSYTLIDRDGYVYVSVKRWDEDNSNASFFPNANGSQSDSSSFPNGRPLWQFFYHNPTVSSVSTTGQGLMQVCNGLTLPGGWAIGFGLEPQTVAGLGAVGVLPQDQTALANAFMLNDEASGTANVDPSAQSNATAYNGCLSAANELLANAPESHACLEYVASRNASEYVSGNSEGDYSLKFVPCDEQPEDLNSGGTGLSG